MAVGHAPEPGRNDPTVVPAATEPLRLVVARFNLALRRQEWAAMRACCHDEAVIDSVTAGKPLGPDETVAAVRSAYRAGIYSVDDWTNEDVAEGVVLSTGGVQHRPGPGLMTDMVHYWITTGRDGLMWRVKAFDHRATALAHFEQFGMTLGLGEPLDEEGALRKSGSPSEPRHRGIWAQLRGRR
jgi:hypothetical protein